MTAPWSTRAVDALRGDLFHVAAGQVLPAVGDPVDLDVAACEVVFDDGWSPHVQATLTAKVPEAQATLDAIDPRTGTQVLIRTGYKYPGGLDDVHDLALLQLRERPVRRPANTMALRAESAEARLSDLTPLGDTHNYGATVTCAAVIADVLDWALDVTLATTLVSSATIGEAMAITTGADLWGALHDLADRIGGWLYADAAGTWHLDPWPDTIGRSAYIMDVGTGGNLEETEAVLAVDEWGNAVLLDYGDDVYGWATATSGPFAVGDVPTKVVTLKRQTTAPGTQAGRNAAAAAVLARVLSRGRGFTLTGPAAYWLRPGHTLTARLPTGPQERHLVSRVAFDLATGTMTVRTRVPDADTTITTGA